MKSRAAEMRNEFPDRMPGVLIESRADGRGVVEFDTGARIVCDFPPAGSGAVAVGTRGYVNFTGGNIQRAWWRTCSCGDRSQGGPGPTGSLGSWLRYGARLIGRFWLGDPAEEVSLEGAVPAPEDRIDGSGLVTRGPGLYWHSETKVLSVPLATPTATATEYDFEAQVLTIWASEAEAWALTETLAEGYADGYADGFAAASSGTGPGTAYYLGGLAWTNGDPYDPTGSNPGPGSVPGSEEYQDGYLAGWNVGWDTGYQAGWEGAGGPPP